MDPELPPVVRAIDDLLAEPSLSDEKRLRLSNLRAKMLESEERRRKMGSQIQEDREQRAARVEAAKTRLRASAAYWQAWDTEMLKHIALLERVTDSFRS